MRARLVVATVLAMCAGGLATLTTASPAGAVQATGDNAVPWSNGWSWTYGSTSFNYNDGAGTNVTINETVTYSVAGQETFNGHDAYKLNINGTITGGSGDVSGDVNAHLDTFSGTVSGTRYVRRSDLALLQENQYQHLNAKAHVSIVTQGITADIELHLTPSPSWKIHDFPLNSGDSWHTLTDIAYTGGFTYDAGSLGGSGSSPFDGSLHFDAPSNTTTPTINAMGNGSLPTDRSYAANADNSMIEDSYWSTQYKNQVKEYMKIPLDDATLQINRTLTSVSLSGGNTLSATATPSYTCAGNTVTVAGNLSTNAAGVAVTARLDQSQINPGQGSSASTTTGANGAYSVTLPVPAQADGLARGGSQPSRANWGVLVTAPSAGAVGATTVVVTPKDCSTIAYTGAIAGPQTGTATVSAQLSDLATPANAAGRTVTFSLSGGGSVNAVTNAAGVASTTIPVNGPPRSATISASFAGASDLEAASTSTSFTVTTIPTSTTVVANPSTVIVGDPVTFTATVAPGLGSGTPGGSVQFKVDGSDFGAPIALAGGSATSAPISTLMLGFHQVQAVYLGNSDYAGSTSPSTQFRVRNPLLPTTTTEIISPSSAVAGQPVTLSASVNKGSGSDPLTGSVTFLEGSTILGTAGLDGSGNAALVLSNLAVGNHSIVASYSGDDVYGGSDSSPSGVSIAKADVDVVLSSADDTTVTGEAVSFTASIAPVAPGAGVPTGTAQLVVDGTNTGSPVALAGGSATFDPVTGLGAGNHTIAVSYSGDASFKTGSDSLIQHVTKASTSTTVLSGPSPQVAEDPVTITATVVAQAPGSGKPTGTVIFSADGTVIGSAPLDDSGSSSQATFVTSTLPAGTHAITASYGGDVNYVTSDGGPVEQQIIEAASVVATTTSVTSSNNPSTYGELITFTAHVEAEDDSQPDGVVQFSIDGTDIGDPVPVDANGDAESPTVSSPEPGDHLVIAAFSSDAAYAASGEALTQQVDVRNVYVHVDPTPGQIAYGEPITFKAQVFADMALTPLDQPATGFIQFMVDGQPLGDAVTLDGDGKATSIAIATIPPGGIHAVTAYFSGDAYYAPTAGMRTLWVEKVATSTTLAASTTSPTYGDPVTLTATVAPAATALGAPTGTVTFLDGSTTLATIPLAAVGNNGKASLTVSNLGGGAHPIKAVYSGATQFAASSSAVTTVNVGKRATTMKADAALLRLNPLLGINVGFLRATLTTSAGPLAGQPVVFTIGGSVHCTAITDGAGVASCDALSKLLQLTLAGGFKATYAGNANYLGSTDNGGLIK